MQFIDADVTEAMSMLDDIAERVEDRHLLTIGGDMLSAYEHKVFTSRGRGRWRRLSLATVATKHSSRPMIDTGLLFSNLSTPRVSGDTVAVTARNRNHIARFHRQGARGRPKRDVSPRPTRREREQWAHQLLTFLASGES